MYYEINSYYYYYYYNIANPVFKHNRKNPLCKQWPHLIFFWGEYETAPQLQPKIYQARKEQKFFRHFSKKYPLNLPFSQLGVFHIVFWRIMLLK